MASVMVFFHVRYSSFTNTMHFNRRVQAGPNGLACEAPSSESPLQPNFLSPPINNDTMNFASAFGGDIFPIQMSPRMVAFRASKGQMSSAKQYRDYIPQGKVYEEYTGLERLYVLNCYCVRKVMLKSLDSCSICHFCACKICVAIFS